MSESPIVHLNIADPLQCAEGGIYSISQKVIAHHVKDIDKFLLNNIRDILVENGFTDVYLLDETFILNALAEHKERVSTEPIPVRRLYMHIGCPVWLSDPDYGWALVHLEASGVVGVKKEPYLTTMDRDHRIQTICARHYAARGGKIFLHKPQTRPISDESKQEDAACVE